MNKVLTLVLTGGLIVLAAFLAFREYSGFLEKPWTRDGQVQADLILVAPRISGPVRRVHVRNNQAVKAGDLLFELETTSWEVAVNGRQAALAVAKAREAEQDDQTRTADSLHRQTPGAISRERWQQANNALLSAKAAVRQAEADLRTAELHLAYTKVHAPVDGYVTNMNLRPGTLAVADQPLFALIDTSTFRITGFFRETLLRKISPGSPAKVTLMTYPHIVLNGEVESIDWGIARTNGATGPSMLPEVAPTFDWIRLAQRVPVNVRLRDVPPQVLLRVGTTASVQVTAYSSGEENAH